MSGISNRKNVTVWTQKVRNVLENREARSVRGRSLAGKNWKSVLSTSIHDSVIYARFFVFWDDKPKYPYSFIGETQVVFKNHKHPKLSAVRERMFLVAPNKPDFPHFHNYFIGEMSEDNGFLDSSGSLEVEFRVIILRIHHDIRMGSFNFGDPFYDENHFTFLFGKNTVDELYVPDQMLHFHSPIISSMIRGGVRRTIVVQKKKFGCYKRMIQMMHGICYPLKDYQILELLAIARRFKVHCVTRKCELALIHLCSETSDRVTAQWLMDTAIGFYLHRLMGCVLSRVDTVGELKEYAAEMDVERMSGAVMKTMAMRMFDFY